MDEPVLNKAGPIPKKAKTGSYRNEAIKRHDVLGSPLNQFVQNRLPFQDEIIRRYLWLVRFRKNKG